MPQLLGQVATKTGTWYTEYSIRLSRPVPSLEPESASGLFITKSLYAVDKWDYLRLEGSIAMPAYQHLGIRFTSLPVSEWMGYGRLRKKLIQVVDLLVEYDREPDWERFGHLMKSGIAYPGATKKRKRRGS